MTREVSWEVGSDFHWVGMAPGPFLPWPNPAIWFALGRHAVLQLMKEAGTRRNLWLPNYFCSEVVQAWSASANIHIYEDSPALDHPKWETLTPASDDLVVAVNYFGMDDGIAWAEWKRKHACILIEDHSHDPHSIWALTSRADYAFCALRKVMPVPDGAILWSPVRRHLPSPAVSEADAGSLEKLTAMLFKSEYLAGNGSPELKEEFRRLQLSGEASLECAPVSAASLFTMRYLASGAPLLWRTVRRDNARELLLHLRDWRAAVPLHASVSDESAPFGVPLVFASAEGRDYHREFLRSRKIYCPIHWVMPQDSTPGAGELSCRILTIPCDQRYSSTDMQRVAETLIQGACHAR